MNTINASFIEFSITSIGYLVQHLENRVQLGPIAQRSRNVHAILINAARASLHSLAYLQTPDRTGLQ